MPNMPEEESKLDTLSESILNVWENYAGAMQKAAKEIRFRRFWMEKLKEDKDSADRALSRSLRREKELIDLVQDVRTRLWSGSSSEDLEDLMTLLDEAMNKPVDPEDLERNYRK